jgi:Fur family zinc uptake transcriptional regulator
MAIRTTSSDPFTPQTHDHRRCVMTAVEAAATLCTARGERLTELRRRVLELVWQSHAPIGAYQVLDCLSGERGRVAPPTVYRALEFLTRQGLVHRIDSLNAYVGCSAPSAAHQAYFLICRRCGDAAEFHDSDLTAALARCVDRASFHADAATVELAGLCARCANEGPKA